MIIGYCLGTEYYCAACAVSESSAGRIAGEDLDELGVPTDAECPCGDCIYAVYSGDDCPPDARCCKCKKSIEEKSTEKVSVDSTRSRYEV
jgi:hypothetical protein